MKTLGQEIHDKFPNIDISGILVLTIWFESYIRDFAESVKLEEKKIPDSIPVSDELMQDVIKGMYVKDQGYNQALSDQSAKIAEELKARGI